MSERKPRLDWIKKVLVDADEHECASTESRVFFGPRAVAFAPRIVPGNQLTPPRSFEAGDEGALLCPSWQLMRLTATQKS